MVITNDDLVAFEYYNQDEQHTSLKEKARLRSMTPLDMTKEYQQTVGQKSGPLLAHTMLNCIQEEYEEFHNSGDTEDELKELSDLVYVIYGYANAMGWDLDEAVRRVHKNNMGRMYQEDGTIKRREDGKIIKRPGYPKVKLDDLV